MRSDSVPSTATATSAVEEGTSTSMAPAASTLGKEPAPDSEDLGEELCARRNEQRGRRKKPTDERSAGGGGRRQRVKREKKHGRSRFIVSECVRGR